ncbi:multiple organellar RNA editing factor 7, mitochondrial-like [Mangifera indica]|uniref:multiple organellar RNA editing factor 7, mitochondrial-like n=1 Tax=Mangifera indica TaxID=29780 RepID=UPI001CFA4A8B|nr:multiple organellar RNA editing factor 7, mitochondrial-like [Mangifera indica]
MPRSLIRNLMAPLLRRHLPSSSPSSFFSSGSEVTQLSRVPNLLEGCDYEHWLVVMEAPKGYPLRDEIANSYVKTLAMAFGSEEEAKKSIYSVSTKYYYAVGCKVPEKFAYKIKSLPNVKWVLPDSYLFHGENSYGGEPFVNGEVVPYDVKYHMDWIQDKHDDKFQSSPNSRKPRRKRRKNQI